MVSVNVSVTIPNNTWTTTATVLPAIIPAILVMVLEIFPAQAARTTHSLTEEDASVIMDTSLMLMETVFSVILHVELVLTVLQLAVFLAEMALLSKQMVDVLAHQDCSSTRTEFAKIAS